MSYARTRPSPTTRQIILAAAVFVLVPLIFGGISILLGKDMNWDLRNYHYYNAFAFVHHRMGFDIGVAQTQTWFNPFLDLPFYFMARHFPARVTGFVLGAVHGLNFWLVFLISLLCLQGGRVRRRAGLAALIACVSVIAPGFISELGNTMNDNLISLMVLSAVALILLANAPQPQPGTRPNFGLLGAAGAALGLAVGFKLVAAAFVPGAVIAVLMPLENWGTRWRALAFFGAGGLLGALLSGGYWWAQLYLRYGSPVLPMFNNFFQSPYWSTGSFATTTFLPTQAWEYLVWPVVFSLDGMRVNTLPMRDIRFGLLYLAGLAALLAGLLRTLRGRSSGIRDGVENLFSTSRGNILLAFMVVSFVAWMIQFSVYRYIITLELLVPLCFLLVLDRMALAPRWLAGLSLVAAAVSLMIMRPPNWDRMPWTDLYFPHRLRESELAPSGLVVAFGFAPMSYLIPEFPAGYRFIRPEAMRVSSLFGAQLREVLASYDGQVYVLYDRTDRWLNLPEALRWIDLTVDPGGCRPLIKVNDLDEFELCTAYRGDPRR
jgi:hypothetical protein